MTNQLEGAHHRFPAAHFNPRPARADPGQQVNLVGRREVRPLPKPVKLGPRITAWRIEDIRALIERAHGA
jgi:hypothetical protein